jgi:hypothetical protein
LSDYSGAPFGVPSCEDPVLTRQQLSRYIRDHIAVQTYDESGVPPCGVAIYCLSDPRDIREVHYVGQTAHPQRRFHQHLDAARLWLPDERPWWVKSPTLRPLYDWVRDLYKDNMRLPTMVIANWVDTAAQARLEERARIFDCLTRRLPLLNVEKEVLGRQIALL